MGKAFLGCFTKKQPYGYYQLEIVIIYKGVRPYTGLQMPAPITIPPT